MVANYEGIGPVFKIKLELQNLGKVCMVDIFIVLNMSDKIYKIRNRQPKVPMLVPQLIYKIDVEVECVDPMGSNDMIRVFVFNKESNMPLITANV
jgi:hypothetical protein